MKNSILLPAIIILASSLHTNAQVKRLPLSKCIEYAIKNNIDLKSKKKEIDIKEIELNTSKNAWYPDLNAGMEHNFDFGRSPSADGSIVDQNSSNTSFGAQLNMPIFTGFKRQNTIKANELNLNAGMEALDKAREELSITVTSYYLQVLYNKELMKISQLDVNLAEEKVQQTQALVETGRAPAAQLYDMKAQLANDKLALVESKNKSELALLDLLQLLELERNKNKFDVVAPQTGDIIKEYMGSILPPENIYNRAVGVKPAIKEQEYLLESSKKMLKVAQSAYYPQLDFMLRYTTGHYHYYNFDNNPSFATQLKNNRQRTIGFTLTIPIFNRFEIRNSVRAARINIDRQELAIENARKALFKEIQQAYYNAVGAQEKYLASEESVKATRESLKYAEDRYLTGRNSVFEYNEAKNKYTQSLYERAQAKYDFIFRAKILDYYNGVPITL